MKYSSIFLQLHILVLLLQSYLCFGDAPFDDLSSSPLDPSQIMDDPEYCDSDYIGLSFIAPSESENYIDSFSDFGLSRFQNISFKIQVNCSQFAIFMQDEDNSAPSLYLYAHVQMDDDPTSDDISNWQQLIDLKMTDMDDMLDLETKDEMFEFIDEFGISAHDSLNTTNFTGNDWYNIWRLEANTDYISDETCSYYFDPSSDTEGTSSPSPEPTASPTTSPTKAPSSGHIYETYITFEWSSEYSNFFPIFQNYETNKEQEPWTDSDVNQTYEILWNNETNTSLIYELILFKNDASNWLNCFYANESSSDDEVNQDWQLEIDSYYGCEDGHCNLSNGSSEYLSDEIWQYQLTSIPYTPMIAWPNCNVSVEPDEDSDDKLCERWSGSDQDFNLYFWYDDDVWTNSLKLYQTLTQYALEEALCDLWNQTNSEQYVLTPHDFYLHVTYFFNFCLLVGNACPNYDGQKDEDELVWYPSDIDSNDDLGGYQMYATLYSNAKYSEKIYNMLNNEERSTVFMDYVSQRFVEDQGRANFIISGYAIGDLPQRTIFAVPVYISYAVYGFVIFCTLFAIAGAIHGFGIWGADCIRISGIVYFGLYTWDFYSDIVFCLELLNYDNTEILFYCCCGFILIPWIANMISLSKYQNRWCRDDTIRERVYQWFVSWQRLTYALAAISGSAFGTVELANSYVFGLDFFCMGLNERHLKKFNNNRLWSGIIAENAPQLIIQFVFLSLQDWEPENNIVWLAIISSSLSIGAALLDIYSAKKLFQVLKRDGEYVGKISCSMFVLSQEIKENAKRLQISTYAFRDALAETLTTHPRSVEMHFPITTSNGFKMKFTVFSSKLQPNDVYQRLRRDATSSDAKIEAELPKKIKKVWNLKLPVRVPLDRIEVENIDLDLNEIEMMETNNNTSSKKFKEGNKKELEMNLLKQQHLNNNNNEGNGDMPTYDANTFATNLNNIVSAQNENTMPGMINLNKFAQQQNIQQASSPTSPASTELSEYESQMNALNAQIAMNQYLMMQQMNAMQQNKNETDEKPPPVQQVMMQQMNEMNNMINQQKQYDPHQFQQFHQEWKKAAVTTTNNHNNDNQNDDNNDNENE